MRFFRQAKSPAQAVGGFCVLKVRPGEGMQALDRCSSRWLAAGKEVARKSYRQRDEAKPIVTVRMLSKLALLVLAVGLVGCGE